MKRVGFFIVAALLASACSGGDSSSTLPTSPATPAPATATGSSSPTSADGTKTGTTTSTAIIGTISGRASTCPTVTFKVETKSIATDAATTYGEKACADLKDGVRIGVTGVAQGDGSILATQVKFAPPPPPPPPPSPGLTGAVTAVSGTCPSITITIGTRTATTSAVTVFQGKACGDVTVGTKVGIYGTIAAGAPTLSATKVMVR